MHDDQNKFRFHAEWQMLGTGTPDVIMESRLGQAKEDGLIEDYEIKSKFPDTKDEDFFVLVEFSFDKTLTREGGGGSYGEAKVWGTRTGNKIIHDTDIEITSIEIIKESE